MTLLRKKSQIRLLLDLFQNFGTPYLLIFIYIYIYQTLIHPHLNFGLAAWDQASKTSLNEILILQKKVLRMIYFTDIREHAIPLFLDADILPVSFMCYKTVASLMHDINSNNSPTNLSNLFEKT